MEANKRYTITIKEKKKLKCSCPDFIFKGSKYGTNCKHIIYIMRRVLEMDLKNSKNNKLQKFKNVYKKLKTIKTNQENNQVDIGEGKICPVCFTEMRKEDVGNIHQCQCKGQVHKDCMKIWLKHSAKSVCLYCGKLIFIVDKN